MGVNSEAAAAPHSELECFTPVSGMSGFEHESTPPPPKPGQSTQKAPVAAEDQEDLTLPPSKKAKKNDHISTKG